MADFNWQNRYLAHLTTIQIVDTMFSLSLWEIQNPYLMLELDCCSYAIKVEAFPYYSRRITFYKECKKGLISVGFLPAENVDSQAFKDKLKYIILNFFKGHPEIIEDYNLHHIPEERIEML